MAIPENSEANLYPLPLSGKTNLNVELESAETKLRNVHKVLKTIYVLSCPAETNLWAVSENAETNLCAVP